MTLRKSLVDCTRGLSSIPIASRTRKINHLAPLAILLAKIINAPAT
jgi:hypothetical protein